MGFFASGGNTETAGDRHLFFLSFVLMVQCTDFAFSDTHLWLWQREGIMVYSHTRKAWNGRLGEEMCGEAAGFLVLGHNTIPQQPFFFFFLRKSKPLPWENKYKPHPVGKVLVPASECLLATYSRISLATLLKPCFLHPASFLLSPNLRLIPC